VEQVCSSSGSRRSSPAVRRSETEHDHVGAGPLVPSSHQRPLDPCAFCAHAITDPTALVTLQVELLGRLALVLAQALGDLPCFVEHYRRDLGGFGAAATHVNGGEQLSVDVAAHELHAKLPSPLERCGYAADDGGFKPDTPVPCIFGYLLSCIRSIGTESASELRIAAFPQIAAVVFDTTRRISRLYKVLSRCTPQGYGAAAESLALSMVEMGIWSEQDLDDIPIGVALPLREALRSCRLNPPQVSTAMHELAMLPLRTFLPPPTTTTIHTHAHTHTRSHTHTRTHTRTHTHTHARTHTSPFSSFFAPYLGMACYSLPPDRPARPRYFGWRAA
jgi:hypothetical protein